jgi:hypothetical protein
MYYVSYGKPNKISDDLMDKAVLFASDFLEIDESVEIDFGGEFDNDCAGYCDYDEEDGITLFVNPKLNKKMVIMTLFHEFVHAKQYINGELVSGIGNRRSRWNGKPYDGDYYSLPWEKEAYELEAVMSDIFFSEVSK